MANCSARRWQGANVAELLMQDEGSPYQIPSFVLPRPLALRFCHAEGMA